LIAVLVEFGGEKLLGKAREISDSLGLRVVAVCSSAHGTDAFCQRLISLGADEVLKCSDPSNVFEWSEALSTFLENHDEQIKFIFAISGLFSDAILGRVYALSRDRVSSFATGLDSITETEATKNLRSWGASLHFGAKSNGGKVSIISFKPDSVPEPFEDSSRYGKISEVKVNFALSTKDSPKTIGLERQNFSDSSSVLTFLVGNRLAKKEPELKAVRLVASKYHGNLVIMSGKVQDVYGPCLAINVNARGETDLPTFHEELISISNSSDQAISRIADTSFVTENILGVLENL
jgi:hypothetical protein